MTPLASATDGPPRSSFEISSPVDSFTTGGPAVKIAPWLAHDGPVAHRRDQRAVPGRRAEQAADRRHLARALRLGEQVGGGAAVVLAAGPEAGALEQHHQRDPVAQRQFGEPVALGVAAWADAAGQRGEVLGARPSPGSR